VHELPEAAGSKWALETLGNGYIKRMATLFLLVDPVCWRKFLEYDIVAMLPG